MQGRGYVTCQTIFLVLTHEMHETHEPSFGPQHRKVCLMGILRLSEFHILGYKRQSHKINIHLNIRGLSQIDLS